MANDWILDVLSDLKAFATRNGYEALTEKLEETVLVAATEISSSEASGPELAGWEVELSGDLSRGTAAR